MCGGRRGFAATFGTFRHAQSLCCGRTANACGSPASLHERAPAPGRRAYRAIGYPEAMLTLSLLRHAKSSWDDASLKDFDRPLSKRGETAAPRMGAYMAAARARARARPVLSRRARAPDARPRAAAPRRRPDGRLRGQRSIWPRRPCLLARVRKVEAKVRHVMIVGHDPGMQGLAARAGRRRRSREPAGAGAPSFRPPGSP